MGSLAGCGQRIELDILKPRIVLALAFTLLSLAWASPASSLVPRASVALLPFRCSCSLGTSPFLISPTASTPLLLRTAPHAGADLGTPSSASPAPSIASQSTCPSTLAVQESPFTAESRHASQPCTSAYSPRALQQAHWSGVCEGERTWERRYWDSFLCLWSYPR